MRRARVAALAAALVLSSCGSGTAAGGTPAVGSRPGDVAPALAGVTLTGHHASLAAWRGSVAVVLFWASWCTPCQAEQPAVDTLARSEMATGVHFLGVSVDVDRSAAAGYVARFGVPYDSLVDTGQTIVVDYEVAGPPTTFVITRSGHIADELVGELSTATLRSDIAAAGAMR